jgi:toxin-antitoxin system PIN domain toxin
MIAIDTNILVYAHRMESPFNAAAYAAMSEIARTRAWAIPWPCLYEFYSVVTHPRVYAPPSTHRQVIDQIETWLASPYLQVLGEGEVAWPTLRDLIQASRPVGGQIHDAKIAALCLHHGVRELWTADRDFSRYPQLRTVNPLIPTAAGEPPGRYRLKSATASRRMAAHPRSR